MFTSAQALHQILVSTSRAPDQTKFLEALAKELGFTEKDAEIEAATYIVKLSRDVEADIEQIPFGATEKKQAHQWFANFSGLSNYAHLGMDIRGAKGNFLHPNHLLNLTHLHMAMSGHITRVSTFPEAEELAQEFRDIREKIAEQDFPDSIRDALFSRVTQIISMLDKVYFYGTDGIADELNGLVGAIVINAPKTAADTRPFWKDLVNLANRSVNAVYWVDKASGAVEIAKDKAAFLIDILPK
ncbi:hypothetical protein [Ruegeria halocynthiae]|uniref:hypothetical protein n=1 Tax=Ruegeria halocynthiae TaxID=985054 RepID=UPI001267C4B4|nr:hypothetical protein [Ruegeria halocynthiae]